MLVVVCSTLFLSVLLWFNYSAVLPAVADAWALDGTEAGLLFGAFQAGYLLGVLPLGLLTDRRSSRQIIAGGATLAALASAAFGLVAHGLVGGVALRFLAGIGAAGVYVPGMRFVSDWIPPATRGRAMGVYVGTFSAGSGASFVLTSTIAARVDWRAGIIATSVVALFAGPLMYALGREAPSATRDGGTLDLGVLRNRSFLATVGVYGAHNWELYGIRNWLPAFLVSTVAVQTSRTPTVTAGLIAGGVTAAGGLGNVSGGWLSDRLGRVPIVAVALAASALGTLVIGLSSWRSITLLGAVVVSYGIVLTMDSAPTSTIVTEVVRDDRLGTGLSIQAVLGTLPGVLSPILFGAALDTYGFGVALATLGVGAGLGLVPLAILRVRRHTSS